MYRVFILLAYQVDIWQRYENTQTLSTRNLNSHFGPIFAHYTICNLPLAI